MRTLYSRNLMLAAAVVIALNFSSCGKYEDGPSFSLMSKKSRLTGEWEVVKIDNTTPDEDIILEFERDGDFSFTYAYDGYSYTYGGEWEWEESKEEIEIQIGTSIILWEVQRLTNSELWFEDEDNSLWELEKK